MTVSDLTYYSFFLVGHYKMFTPSPITIDQSIDVIFAIIPCESTENFSTELVYLVTTPPGPERELF